MCQRDPIFIMELNSRRIDQPIGKFKWDEDGRIRVIRGFFVSIKANKNTVWKEFPKDKKHWLYDPEYIDENGYDMNYFHETEYYLSEREMNGFIQDNYGIDHYETIGKYAYMLADCMEMMKGL